MTSLRGLAKIVLLLVVAVLHLPLVAWSAMPAPARRRRTGRRRHGRPSSPSSPATRAAAPAPPRTSSRCCAAATRRVSPWSPRRRVPERFGASRGQLLTWPLSLPAQCRSLVLGDPGLRAQLDDAETLIFEFFSTALLLYQHRPRAGRIVLRDHEVLIRKTDMERRATRGLESLGHAARLLTCYLVS